MIDIGSLSQEQTVAVEKEPFNIVLEIKDSENINQFRKRLKRYLFGESYDMNQQGITLDF